MRVLSRLVLLSTEGLLCAYPGEPFPCPVLFPVRSCREGDTSQSGAAEKEVMLAWKAGSPSEGQYLSQFSSPAKVLCQS